MTPERLRQIEELYHAARGHPAALESADPELRREVESLLEQSGSLPNLAGVRTVAGLGAGSSLGPYRIDEFLGAGGMGEVYRATDTKLGRKVAIKVLPESFARDVERMARFRREAQVLACLNHPNIAQIYGLEEHALVMELVEGPTLAERIERGPMPLDEALVVARQITEALEAAHEKRIIHRDLKPSNVKITSAGVVKLLDFGLATVAEAPTPISGQPPDIPEVSRFPTLPGVILGTAAYMSPEQAHGAAVDRRTDIWAFGVVLYEMLTGRQLFKGDTISDTLALVLTKEPDWNRAPAKAQSLLRRCLERDPDRRLHDIADAWMLLDAAPQIAPAKRRRPWLVAAAALCLLLAIAVVGWWRGRLSPRSPLQPLVRLQVDLGSDVSIGSTNGTDVVLSPDGTRLVYVSRSRLFTRRLDQPNATELPGTELAAGPFFSPDGQWVGFFAPGKLKKVSVNGGAAISLCSWVSAAGGSWGEDDNIIAGEDGVLSRIPSAGGEPVPITELAAGEYLHRWPQLLPGSRAVLFTAFTGAFTKDGSTIQVQTLRDRRRKTVHRGGRFGRYLASGHLVYLDRDTLFAAPFDLDRLEVRGTPVPVLEGVADGRSGSAKIAFSSSLFGHGTVVYRRSGAGSGLATVQSLDSAGAAHPIIATPGDYGFPSLSPDSKWLALGSAGGIWVCDVQRGAMRQLTFDGGVGPVWTPDGRYIAYMVYTTTVKGLFWTRADGASKPRALIENIGMFPQGWSFAPDGKRLAFQIFSLANGFDIVTLPLEREGAALRAGKPDIFLQTRSHELQPAFSPDGRWLAYTSNATGSFEVYVRAFPDTGGVWQVSNSGGLNPQWSRNGQELFFRTLDGQIMVAAYKAHGDSFTSDQPRAWCERRIASRGVVKNYDVFPDGKHIVALMPIGGPEGERAENHVVFLLNFFDELRRKAP